MLRPAPRPPREARPWMRYLLLGLGIILVTLMIPKKGKFRYEYREGSPWLHEDLIAPFSFPILKSEDQVTLEQRQIRQNFKPYYRREDEVSIRKKNDFLRNLDAGLARDTTLEVKEKDYLRRQGQRILGELYVTGIYNPRLAHNSSEASIIQEVRHNEVTDQQLGNFYSLEEAKRLINDRLTADTLMDRPSFLQAMLGGLDYNIIYDSTLSTRRLNELIDNISPTRGMVREGDLIIAKGNMVTEQRFQMLESMRREYEGQLNRGRSGYMFFAGYFILVAVLFLMYGAHLESFQPEVLRQTRALLAILLFILLFVGMTSLLARREGISIFIIPYSIAPIVLLAIFGNRVAIMTHLLIVLLCGLMVANPFEFVLLQALTGILAVLSMMRIRYISQFFVTTMTVFLSYSTIYFGLSLLHATTFREINWQEFGWFGGNFILTLMAYPLIYVNEKIFGFLSDMSLLELADINNKLLKELSVRAPGTFQHSLQVANLAEAVIDRIGGNALLTRVGALYHDVGKIYNPTYFIENQSFLENPHEQLNDEQSAEIIISHVTKGVELAEEYHLPSRVIDFIRTHHGTTRVEYFYQHFVKNHPTEDVDEGHFRYPGPKPGSKEQAVVMIADSIEAASRSIKNADEKQIDILVDKIIDYKLADHQFDLANITIQEINTTRRLMKKLVKSIYHIRIIYPSEAEQRQD